MNPTLETILTRRSIHRFKPDMLPRETIDQIIEAGLYAPSGMNTQNTVIIAITNPEIRDRLSRANAAVMGSERDPFYGAPVVLSFWPRRSGEPTCTTAVWSWEI